MAFTNFTGSGTELFGQVFGQEAVQPASELPQISFPIVLSIRAYSPNWEAINDAKLIKDFAKLTKERDLIFQRQHHNTGDFFESILQNAKLKEIQRILTVQFDVQLEHQILIDSDSSDKRYVFVATEEGLEAKLFESVVGFCGYYERWIR